MTRKELVKLLYICCASCHTAAQIFALFILAETYFQLYENHGILKRALAGNLNVKDEQPDLQITKKSFLLQMHHKSETQQDPFLSRQ